MAVPPAPKWVTSFIDGSLEKSRGGDVCQDFIPESWRIFHTLMNNNAILLCFRCKIITSFSLGRTFHDSLVKFRNLSTAKFATQFYIYCICSITTKVCDSHLIFWANYKTSTDFVGCIKSEKSAIFSSKDF